MLSIYDKEYTPPEIDSIKKEISNKNLTFLLGNGINKRYAPNTSKTWDQLLRTVSNNLNFNFQSIDSLELTEQYSAMVLSKGENTIREQVIKKTCHLISRSAFKRLNTKLRNYNCPILTTNIDSNLDPNAKPRELDNNYLIKEKRLEELNHPSMWNLNHYWSDRELFYSSEGYAVWHIHGHYTKEETIRFGLVDYGKLLSRINLLLDGYTSESYDNRLIKRTWVYPFINNKLCIVGLSLKSVEVFIRWFLLRKAHIMKTEEGVSPILGWYLYTKQNDIGEGTLQFLHSVHIVTIKFNSYDELYQSLFV